MTGGPAMPRSRWRKVAYVLLWAAIVTAVVMALLPHPPKLPIDGFGDKFEHMLAFSVIALLAAMSYREVPLTRIGERLSFLGALIEVGQSIPALHRDCDIRDWFADTLAVVVVLGLYAVARRLNRRRRVAIWSTSDGRASPAASATSASARRSRGG